MAPLSPKEAQEDFDSARRESRSRLGAQMALMDEIEVELRRRGRSRALGATGDVTTLHRTRTWWCITVHSRGTIRREDSALVCSSEM